MSRWLERVAIWAGRRARIVFAVTLILGIGSVAALTRLEIETDVLALLPRGDPVIEDFRELADRFGSLDLFLVGIRIPEGAEQEPYQEFADRLAAGLRGMETIEYVDYRLGATDELFRDLMPSSLLFLEEEERARLEERLSTEGLRERAEVLRRLVTSPQSLMVEPLMRLDPLGLSDFFLERVRQTGGALSVDLSSGYYLSRDHRLLLVLAKPERPAQDIDYAGRLVDRAEELLASVKSEWGEIAEGTEEVGSPPETFLGGGYVTALDDASLITRDVIWNAVTSLGVVLLLFLWAFRRFGPVLFALLPLVAGVLFTFSFTSLTLGRVSSATGGTGALLIGLAIDFVIVSYGRYVEERRRGSSVGRSIRRMSGSSGRAVVVGAVTSAATFYAFLVTDFTGLRQMGIIAGTGILICMVTVLVLLPALLVWNEEHHRKRESRPTMYLHAFGTAHLVRWSVRRPRATLLVGGLITLILGGFGLTLEFQDSMREMRSPKNRGVRALDEVSEHFGASFEFMSLMIESEDLGEVLTLADRASERARGLVDEGVLDGYESVATILPPPARQRRALEWLADRSARVDPERVRRELSVALREEGLRPEAFEEGLALLEEALRVDRPIAPESLSLSPENRRLLERYLRREGDVWHTVVRLYPPPQQWKREPPPAVEELAEELGPAVTLTGINVVSRHLREKSRRQAVTAALLGFLLVGALLWLDFGRLDDALLSLVPLGVGIVWMLGLMAVLGIAVNLMNIFVTTMIIGIGVDYGIHAMHRFRETPAGDVAALSAGLLETGKAIVLAALSTVAGFGSMALSRYPGLQSIGYVAILGALSTALVSVTLLPAWFRLRMKDVENPRSPEEDPP